MCKALVTFANGETLTIHEAQQLVPLVSTDNYENHKIVLGEIYKIWYHHHDALIPSILHFFSICEFFFTVDNPKKVYNPKTVVSITQL